MHTRDSPPIMWHVTLKTTLTGGVSPCPAKYRSRHEGLLNITYWTPQRRSHRKTPLLHITSRYIGEGHSGGTGVLWHHQLSPLYLRSRGAPQPCLGVRSGLVFGTCFSFISCSQSSQSTKTSLEPFPITVFFLNQSISSLMAYFFRILWNTNCKSPTKSCQVSNKESQE